MAEHCESIMRDILRAYVEEIPRGKSLHEISQQLVVSTVASAPDSTAPIESVAVAVTTVGTRLQEHRDYSRQRQMVIAANAELQERELIKLAALADTLRQRGVADPAASLTAEAGIAVFKIAFQRWPDDTGQRDLPELIRELFDELKAVTAGT